MTYVDLDTRIIPPDHQVFVMHPGTQKKFYRNMISGSEVFLDLPGITFEGALAVDDPLLLQKFMMSRAIRQWHAAGRPEGREPSRDPAAYADNALTSRRSIQLRSIVALYQDARVGDLVVVPGPGYASAVLIGEIISDYAPGHVRKEDRYPGESMPVRIVRWKSTSRKKAQFSNRAIELMQNQKAIIRVKEPDILLEIYREAYGNFVLPDYAEGRVRIEKPTIDFAKFLKSGNTIIYAAALFNAAGGGTGTVREALALGTFGAIQRFYDPTQLLDTGISINSPGFIALKAKELALPLFVGVMLALGAAGVPLDEARAADLANSTTAQSLECEIEMEERFRTTMAMMSYEDWSRWCTMAQQAQGDVGMTAHPKVRPGKKPPPPSEGPLPRKAGDRKP